MALKISKNLIFFSIIFCLLLSFSCGSSETELVENDQNEITKDQTIPGLPPGIPSYPYIFSGKFYLNSSPGPENSIIISKLGELDSPEITSGYGTFEGLIIGPKTSDDIKNNIEFYLKTDDEKMIKAEEELPYDVITNITNLEIELNFNE
tara:strand:- start:1433 stop:1882 length:450 start_codon:yes stop_codon:yes gene_type:complete